MPNELSRDEIDALINHHRRIFDDAENKIDELKKVSFYASMRINALMSLKTSEERLESESADFKDIFEAVYSSQWTLVKKVEFVLKNITQKISSTREIAEAIKKREEVSPVVESKIVHLRREDQGQLYIDSSTKSYTSYVNDEYIAINTDEPSYRPEVDINELVNNLGATLIQKVKKKDMFARVDIKGTFYYGLIEWFENDKIKKEYCK